MKSCLGGNDYPALIRLSESWSLPIKDHLAALGVEWMLHHAITLPYDKEMKRVMLATEESDMSQALLALLTS